MGTRGRFGLTGQVETGEGKRRLPHLVARLRTSFYLGRLAQGDRLPSVRGLARQLGISPTTVLNLYRQLEDEGFVEGKPRSGTFLRTLGLEPKRPRRHAALFEQLTETARWLELRNASPLEFTRLLLRVTGVTRRDDYRFGFLSHRESFEMLSPSIVRRLRFDPLVLLSPDPRNEEEVRAHLARDRSIRCILSTYLYSTLAFRLAREFDRHMIVIQIRPESARILEPPAQGSRAIITRDPDCADAFRTLLDAVDAAGAGRFYVADVGDAEAMAVIERDAAEIFASGPGFEAATAWLGGRRPVTVIPSGVAERTIDDMLYHYVFADERAT